MISPVERLNIYVMVLTYMAKIGAKPHSACSHKSGVCLCFTHAR